MMEDISTCTYKDPLSNNSNIIFLKLRTSSKNEKFMYWSILKNLGKYHKIFNISVVQKIDFYFFLLLKYINKSK